MSRLSGSVRALDLNWLGSDSARSRIFGSTAIHFCAEGLAEYPETRSGL